MAVWLVTGGVLFGLSADPASAQGVSQNQYESSEGETSGGRMTVLEERVAEQDAALEAGISRITEVGRDLRETQARVVGAEARAGELKEQTRKLREKIGVQDRAYREARADYEERARAAYKGQDVESLGALIEGWLGSGREASGGQISSLSRVLVQGRSDLEAYERSKSMLEDLKRQISQKQRDYRLAIDDERASAEELRRQEAVLDEAMADLRSDRDRTSDRLRELEAAERARIERERAASGGGTFGTNYQMGVARDDIFTQPVAPLPRREYMRLYRESAARYGFGQDWYVLAAVGQVESNHGQNMGPSTAGAMGPMQFLPSTWATSGVDGDGNGTANIMDPKDAIPAAAGYLKDGGAPRDWYAALYSYNHADWYVKKVLAVAEAYRQLAKDDSVPPYV